MSNDTKPEADHIDMQRGGLAAHAERRRKLQAEREEAERQKMAALRARRSQPANARPVTGK
jgi:hypothetical protein